MKSRVITWGMRIALVVAAFFAPAVGYFIRVSQTGNAELAIDGIGWGMLAAPFAAIVFALTFPARGVGRLGRGAAFVVAIILLWAAVLAVPVWFPA